MQWSGDPMTGNQAIIRRKSGSSLVFETPEGNYQISPDDIRNILFHGHRVLLAQDDGIVDSEAMVHAVRTGFKGARRIVFSTASHSFSIADLSFISIVKGKWAAATMVAERTGTADHVA
jgi:hypothetical protein